MVSVAAVIVLLVGQAAGKPLPSTLLMRIETAVEGELRQVERGGTLQLRDVTVTPRIGGASINVLLTLPRRQSFEDNAERAYESVWKALTSQPNAYRELGRIVVALKRSSSEMTVDCPARLVEGSEGKVHFQQLKKSCRVR